MDGLLILFIVVIWFSFLLFLINKITLKINNYFVKFIGRLILVLLIFILPFVDEIFAKYQFKKICSENAVPWVSKEAKGKIIYLEDSDVKLVSNAWVKIVKQPWNYVDVNTRKVIISYNVFLASGGRVTKTFLSPISNGPFIFDGYCGPVYQPDSEKYFELLGVQYIKRSDIKKWEIGNHEN